MRTTHRLLLASLVACGGLSIASCEDEPPTERVDIRGHLYEPGARLAPGITVPDGATRIGPTIPIDQDRDGITSRISMLQIDGDPDRVIRDLLADLDDRIADLDIDPTKSRRRCWLDESDEWIQQCRMIIAGHTASGQPLQIDFLVTPTADPDGEPLPGTTGLPQARLLIRGGIVRDADTNLYHEPGYPYSIRDQEAARWPITSDADTTVDGSIETVPGAGWPVRSGGFPIGVVLTEPVYAVVAVDEGENLQAVALSYISAVQNIQVNSKAVARVGQRTTTSYEIDEVDGGPSAHLWAVDRPGTDYLYLRYWPPTT